MTTPVTPAEVEALEALLAKATQRPWSIDDDDGGPVAFIEPEINYGNGYEGEIKSKDARLIVAAVNALPRLLAALRDKNAGLFDLLGECLALIRDHDRVPVILDGDVNLLISRLDAALSGLGGAK